MSLTLTAKQNSALAYIRRYQLDTGTAPSYEEIAAHLGLASRSGVSRVIHELTMRGALRKPAGRARCFELLGEHGAEFHLKAVLASFSENGIAYAEAPAVVGAMRFLGMRVPA